MDNLYLIAITSLITVLGTITTFGVKIIISSLKEMRVSAEHGREKLHTKIDENNKEISKHLEDHSKRITILETKVG
jgi:hypothetical protein